jgi:hypothetical protein
MAKSKKQRRKERKAIIAKRSYTARYGAGSPIDGWEEELKEAQNS